MDYDDELNKAVRVSRAIVCLVECLENLDSRYEPLYAAVFHIICGEVDEDEQQVLGGLLDRQDEICDVIGKLQLEIEVEG